MARTAIERILEDLESAIIFDEMDKPTAEKDSQMLTRFVGMDKEIHGRSADTLRFLSTSHLVLDEWSREYGFSEIVYTVQERGEGPGLILHRNDTPEADGFLKESKGGLIMCEDIFSFNLTYHDADGKTYDSWDSTEEGLNERLPAMISISLDIVNRSNPESPFRFISGVALPVARIRHGGDSL